jgi:hypothetical protein
VGKLRLAEPASPTPAPVAERRQPEASQAIEEEDEDEEEEEEGDVIQPLRSVNSQSSRRVESPLTASTMNETEIQTPISPGYSDNIPYRQNSPEERSSPPRDRPDFGASPSQRDNVLRKAQAQGPGPEVGLGRKESKWRKSVMNLSDVSPLPRCRKRMILTCRL